MARLTASPGLWGRSRNRRGQKDPSVLPPVDAQIPLAPDLTALEPEQKRVTDIAERKTGEGRLSLSVATRHSDRRGRLQTILRNGAQPVFTFPNKNGLNRHHNHSYGEKGHNDLKNRFNIFVGYPAS